eukprot:5175736-Prymnesium_polylepis.1
MERVRERQSASAFPVGAPVSCESVIVLASNRDAFETSKSGDSAPSVTLAGCNLPRAAAKGLDREIFVRVATAAATASLV